MNLPITMKPEEYGNVLVDNFVQIDDKVFIDSWLRVVLEHIQSMFLKTV